MIFCALCIRFMSYMRFGSIHLCIYEVTAASILFKKYLLTHVRIYICIQISVILFLLQQIMIFTLFYPFNVSLSSRAYNTVRLCCVLLAVSLVWCIYIHLLCSLSAQRLYAMVIYCMDMWCWVFYYYYYSCCYNICSIKKKKNCVVSAL